MDPCWLVRDGHDGARGPFGRTRWHRVGGRAGWPGSGPGKSGRLIWRSVRRRSGVVNRVGLGPYGLSRGGDDGSVGLHWAGRC